MTDLDTALRTGDAPGRTDMIASGRPGRSPVLARGVVNRAASLGRVADQAAMILRRGWVGGSGARGGSGGWLCCRCPVGMVRSRMRVPSDLRVRVVCQPGRSLV